MRVRLRVGVGRNARACLLGGEAADVAVGRVGVYNLVDYEVADGHALLGQGREQPRALGHREARRDPDDDEVGHVWVGQQPLQLGNARLGEGEG